MPPPKPLAKATLALGLVRIPLAVYSATREPPEIKYKLVHAVCGSKVAQRYYCERDNTYLEPSECGKAYEAGPGRLLLVSKEEIEALQQDATGEIQIEGSFDEGEIEPVHVCAVKRLGPDPGKGPVIDSEPARRYRWLVEVLAEDQKALLGSWATRGRDLLVAVRSAEGRLELVELRRAEEIRDAAEIEIPEVEVDGAEVDQGVRLVQELELDRFDPGAYPDARYAASLKLLQEKLEKGTITIPQVAAKVTPPVDLAAAITATLGARKGPKRAEPSRRGPKRAAR